MLKRIGAACVLILCVASAGAQDFRKARMWTRYGDESFEEQDYYGASQYYRQALRIDSTNIELHYKYAMALKGFNEYQKAAEVFENVWDADQGHLYPEALFWQAMMEKSNANYRDARKHFKAFTKITRDKQAYPAKKAKQEVKSCAFAEKLIHDSTRIKMVNPGAELNSTNAEFAAVMEDSTHIIFSSLRTKAINDRNVVQDDKYIVELFSGVKKDNIWQDGEPLDAPLNNNRDHSANGTYNADHSVFYFTRCDGSFHCNIYMSRKENGRWSEPEMMPDPINVEGYTSTQPCWAMIGKLPTLIFVSDRPKGKGKMDIWYSQYKKGKWYKAKNIGSKVNTRDDDLTPFWEPTEKKLYFSSGWWYGLGGADIFSTSSAGGTLKGLARPENLKPPYNSPANDLYFSVDKSSNSGFLTSNRIGSITRKGETCCNDLYYFWQPDTTPPPKYESLEQLNKYLPVTLYFHNDEPDPRTWDTITGQNYIETYKAYKALIPDYQEAYATGLEGDAAEKAKLDITNFFEDYVDKGVDDLEIFSDLLLRELQKGQRIEMTVKGYASPLAKTDYNVNLTLRRISSMENYLRSYEDSVYVPYLEGSSADSGSLSIERLPFGEYRADQLISDNPNDTKNSVYSRSAALERKIEIISVHQAGKDSSYAQLFFPAAVHDFGLLTAGDTVSHTFAFSNAGNLPLTIDSATTECGCTAIRYPKGVSIKPGTGGSVEVFFNPSGQKGILSRKVILYTNGNPRQRELIINAEVKGLD